MSARARSKLVRLLADLDPGDSLQLDENSIAQNRDELLDIDDSATQSSDVTEDTDQASPRQSLMNTHRFMQLEKTSVQLLNENRTLKLQNKELMQQSERQASELRSQLRSVLSEIEQRQREVESRAPLMATRIEDYKDRLKELRISETQYQELLNMPQEGLHVLDQIKVAMYKQTRDLSREAEQLRLALADSKDSASRLEEEVGILKIEAARASAALVEREREAVTSSEALQARVSRLSSELEQALIRAELNSAKGQMYDELRLKAERLEQEVSRLLVVEATFKRMESQFREEEKLHRQRDHSVEMLHMDKAYLTKQVEFMAEQQRKTHSELEMRESQVSELQRTRNEMYEKLVEAENGRARYDEARLHKELAQLQASTHSDLERIRLETAETYEREARLLRELRDQAVEEASRAKIALSELQTVHDRTSSVQGELQRKLESQVVELQADLRQKAFEVSHLRVVMGEKEGLLAQSGMQVELLQDKLQVLRERCYALEAAQSVTPHPVTSSVKTVPSESERPGRALSEDAGALAVHATALAALKKEKAELLSRISDLELRLQAAEVSLSKVGQPHAFLLQQLTDAKNKVEVAEQRSQVAKAKMVELESQLQQVRDERDAMRNDMDAVLTHRAGLEEMKRVVMRAVGGNLSGAAGLVPTHSSDGAVHTLSTTSPVLYFQGAGLHGSTTIMRG
ncbi:hypothetical protein CEUSTIGMA_g9825.t1 [Chlamydomonas eustigma]|uniref:Progesterone-induced-blocking factor 1 n=1 Tax=Chlamydomonas eustigma TaxID=1157962 RepID=A0A250XH43_9CHLO|nr:hypothetical protein CEUSTIGMA_g9825.t1 [Chlamydomonas eustigma]|eukprot:GAX82397.1 hypothetical protein CEUSTIGMA_g9825.t1 [Chlamydomonas eustigma]